jgi:hypothetical protein
MMTAQEFSAQIKAKNPNLANVDDVELARKIIKANPSLASKVDFGIEKPKPEPVTQVASPVIPQTAKTNFLDKIGEVGSQGGRSVLRAIEGVSDIGQKTLGRVVGVKEPSKLPSELTRKGITPAEKAGGFIGEVAVAAIPAERILGLASKAKSIIGSKRALSLTAEELAKVNKKRLSYLSKESLDSAKTVGGIIKKKTLAMNEKVKGLQTEFRSLLGGSTEKNIGKVRGAIKQAVDDTFGLIKGSNKSLNLNTVKAKLKNKLMTDQTTSYSSEYELVDVTKKSLNGFLNKVKEGTVKGLEEARLVWRAEKKQTSGQLKKADEVLHTAIKNIIKDNLPEAERKLYDVYKTKMAKLYDVKEILRAKKEASLGKSKIGSILKKTAIGGAAVGTIAAISKYLK